MNGCDLKSVIQTCQENLEGSKNTLKY